MTFRRRTRFSQPGRFGYRLWAFMVVFACSLMMDGALQAQVELPSPSETIAESAVGSGYVADEELADEELLDEPIDLQTMDPIEEIAPEASWWQPTMWISGPTWEKGVELGLNGSEGNAQAFSILTSANLKRDTDADTWGIDVVYGKTEAEDVLTQHYAFLNSRYDYKLGASRWTLFSITRLEYDEFKAFDWRFATNGGVGYAFLKSETRKLTGRFGAGTSREFGGLDDSWIPEAVFGGDYDHQLSKRQKVTLTTDYYPNWKEFTDYRLVTQASWEILLDEETNLSLKLGLLDRYDSTPMGLKPNDVDYFITLLWKM